MRNAREGNAGHTVVSTFENNGLLYGALLGVLVGVLIAGPHFADWSIQKILAAVALSSAVIAIVGHLAVLMAYGAICEGPLAHDDHEEDDDALPDGAQAFDD